MDEPAVDPSLARLIERARQEWLAAQNAFEFVTEPELVDQTVYAMLAAERRYVYLLRLAAREAAADQVVGKPPAGASAGQETGS